MIIIDTVRIEQLNKFPIQLGEEIIWRISPTYGSIYDASAGFSILLDNKVIDSYGITCKYLMSDIVHSNITACGVERNSVVLLHFKPIEKHNGRNLNLIFFRNLEAVFSQIGQLLINTTILLIKEPAFVKMTLTLDMMNDYVRNAPPSLRIEPPIFLDGSMAKVVCKTDGALPPKPISFAITCPSPPKASVEHEKRRKMKNGYPYSVHYHLYNLPGPPTDEELAHHLSREFAKEILREVRISTSPDNLTTTVSVPIVSKAHNCSLSCRLMNKAEEIRLTVYYQTTVAYLLPMTKNGLMYAGSSIACFADGYPSPSISLFLRQPLRQSKSRNILDSHDYLISTSPLPPTEMLSDDSAVSATTRIGLPPDEYVINGSTFSLAYNSTPGVELLLVCTAGNALPGALDFLGTNKTIATARFVVAAISYSRLGLVLGLCLTLLLISILIILTTTLLMRRRQKYTSVPTKPTTEVEEAPTEIFVEGVSKPSSNNQIEQTNQTLRKMRSSLVTNASSATPPTVNATTFQPTKSLNVANKTTSSTLTAPIAVSDEVEYAVLSFENLPKLEKPTSSTMDRRSGSSMHNSTLDSRPDASIEEEEASNYSVIVGTMQPKWYTNSLVLKQQQDAMQTLLAMKKNKPSVTV